MTLASDGATQKSDHFGPYQPVYVIHPHSDMMDWRGSPKCCSAGPAAFMEVLATARDLTPKSSQAFVFGQSCDVANQQANHNTYTRSSIMHIKSYTDQ